MEATIVQLKEWDFGFVHQVLCFYRERARSISSAASEMTTYKGALLRHLVKYGPAFLSQEEFDGCLRRALADYYNFLAVNVALRYDDMFWQYHKRTLDELGIGLNMARLAMALAARCCKAVLEPSETLEKLRSRRKRQTRRDKEAGMYLEIEAVLRRDTEA
jgi:hypothetical protein